MIDFDFYFESNLSYGLRPIPPSKVSVSPDIYLKSGEAS